MTIRLDYHLHTCHSMDCEQSLDTLCAAAVRTGLTEICITDHTEFGHPYPGSDVPPVVEDWLADIEAAREAWPQLTIRAGLEIGDNPLCRERIKRWHAALPLDFKLLSLHLIDQEDPFVPEFFAHRDQATLYRRYVESRLESAMAWEPEEFDAFAHIGYCAKFAPYPLEERPLRCRHAPEAMDALLRRLAENGKALEINTSGRKTMPEFLPDREIVTRFRELGGEFVTLGSDAHTPEYVGRWIDEAAELAKSCGIRWALTFSQRRPIPVAL